jgi:hypothetical protein
MTTPFYLYARGRQRNAAVRDRLQGTNHALRTICKSSEHSTKRSETGSGNEHNGFVNDVLAPRTRGTRQSDELCHST